LNFRSKRYLTKAAVRSTLAQISAHPGGAEVAFDYAEPRENIDPAHRAPYEARAARVAAVGEPFLSHFDPPELHAQLHGLGFDRIDDLDVPAILVRLSGAPSPEAGARASVRRAGGHVLIAGAPARG